MPVQTLTIAELAAILAAAIAEGRGDAPVVFFRGGEDEAAYGLDSAAMGDFVDLEGGIDGGMVLDFDNYSEIGTMAIDPDA